MPTLDATVGGASANSFVSLDDALEYLDTRLNASAFNGDAVEEDDQLRALIEATRELSLLEPVLQGYRTDSTQALCFPRTLVINTKAPINTTAGLTGFPEYADDVIPPDWSAATIELALEFLKAGTIDLAAVDRSRSVIEKTIGPITTRWASRGEGAPAVVAQGIARFPRVLSLVAPFFSDALTGHAVARS